MSETDISSILIICFHNGHGNDSFSIVVFICFGCFLILVGFVFVLCCCFFSSEGFSVVFVVLVVVCSVVFY